MTTTEYGQKLGQALQAVARMHQETAQLLLDCDHLMEDAGRHSLFNDVTRSISNKIGGPPWMAEGVYRAYVLKDWDQAVTWAMVVFHDKEDTSPSEPLCLVANIKYVAEDRKDVDPWDLWQNIPCWNDLMTSLGDVEEVEEELSERIKNVRYVARPLMTIRSINDIKEMLLQLDAPPNSSEA